MRNFYLKIENSKKLIHRVLGFRRSIPHVGRVINITSELYPIADDTIYNTFYISPDNNVCFFGNCEIYCDANHPICGSPDMLEISMGVHLPKYEETERRVRSLSDFYLKINSIF